MNKLSIIYKNVEELKMYEKNPRKNDDAVKYVMASIKEFGFKVPVIIDKDNVIVCGHTRVKGAKELGIDEVPCIIADDLTDEQIKAFRLADNKVSEFALWDFELLNEELDELADFGMQEFGFGLDFDIDTTSDSDDDDEPSVLTDEKYTTKVDIPQYEIRGDNPDLSELYDTSKASELISKIEKANISKEQKEFLKKSAMRHNVFNYTKIAEYYAHQDKEMQELMEQSALVIIDFDDAIKNGFAELKNRFAEIEAEDVGEAYD